MPDSSLSDEERRKIQKRLELWRAEIDAMPPLTAAERDLLRAALPLRLPEPEVDAQQGGAA